MRDFQNVLFFNWNGNGGATEVAKDLKQSLEERGIQADAVYNNPYGAVTYEQNGRTFQFGNWQRFMNDTEHVNLKKYDVLHFNSCTMSPHEFRMTKSLTNASIVYLMHSLISHELLGEMKPKLDLMPDNERQRFLQGYKRYSENQLALMDLADRIICPSKSYVDLSKFYHPEISIAHKSDVIPNGSNFYKFNSDPKVAGLGEIKKRNFNRQYPDGKIAMFAGRLVRDKGVLDLTEAFREVKDGHENSSLLFVGEGEAKKEILNCASANNLQGSVYFSKWVPKRELAAFYKASDVLVLPTYKESFGLVALEAMMMGTPVVVSDIEGPHEFFVDPMLAYGIEPHRPDQIAKNVNWIMDNPERAKKNAETVKKVATEKYSLDRIADRVIEVYNKVRK